MGGYTLPEYYSNFYASGVCARYDYVSGAQSWSGNSTLDDTPSDALSARGWDVIVIQEHTGRSEAWSWPGVLEPAVEGLRDIFYTFRKDSRPTVVYLCRRLIATAPLYCLIPSATAARRCLPLHQVL